MMKKCGHSFKICNKVVVHLVGKMIPYGKMISFGIAHFSFRRTLKIYKNLPQGEERIFLGWP